MSTVTKEEILKHIEVKDCKWFVPHNSKFGLDGCDYVCVEDFNDGDGNAMYLTLHLPDYDLYVSIIGTYSSWASGEWEDVFVSEPYIHTETKYKRKEL